MHPRLSHPQGSPDLLVTKSPTLRRCWHAVAFAGELADAPIPRRLLGVDIVLWRVDGAVHAATDLCPHRWAKLSGGAVHDGQLTCPYHGWRFGTDGRASTIPQLPPGAPLPPAACIEVLTVREHVGMIWVCLDGDPVNDLPVVPEFDDDAYRAIEVGVFDNECNAPAIIDNNTDSTHVAFVHATSFGAGQDPQIPPRSARRSPFGITIDADPLPVASAPTTDEPTTRQSITEIWLPFVQLSRMHYPDGGVHVLLKGMCPVDDAHTRVHLTVLRNDAHAPAVAERIIAFETGIELEDAGVLSSLPAAFPLDVRRQVHLRHDAGGIEYRRALADLLAPDQS